MKTTLGIAALLGVSLLTVSCAVSHRPVKDYSTAAAGAAGPATVSPRTQDLMRSVVAIIDPDGLTIDGMGFLCIVPRSGGRYVVTTAHNLERHLLVGGYVDNPERAQIPIRLYRPGGGGVSDLTLSVVSHESNSDIAVLRVPGDVSIDIVGDNALSVTGFGTEPLSNGDPVIYTGYARDDLSRRSEPLVYDDTVTLFETLGGEPIPLIEARINAVNSGAPVFVRKDGQDAVLVGMLQTFKKDFVDLYTKSGDPVPNNERYSIIIPASRITKVISDAEEAAR